MPIPKQLHNRLLWAAHLLSIVVLPGVFVFLIYRRPQGYLPMDVFWTWEMLALLLPFWVAGLLGWRLWQRRWGQALALAVLVGVDVLVLVGYYLAFFVSSMTADPI